jgi:hypothetical protein
LSTRHGKRKMSNYIGQIGESLAYNYLNKKGFKTMSYMLLVDLSKDLDSKFHYVESNEQFVPLSINIANDFLASKKEDFLKMLKALDRIKSGSEHSRRRFDFISKKNGKFYVVEVKTNTARVSTLQQKELEKSGEFGFNPLLVKTKVRIAARMKDVTMDYL